MAPESSDRPVLRIVRGAPTAEELAAVTALVAAAGAPAERPVPPVRGRWNDPAHRVRRPVLPGPGAWRAAAR